MTRRTLFLLIGAILVVAFTFGAFGVSRARSTAVAHAGKGMAGGMAMTTKQMMSTASHRVGNRVYHGRVTPAQRREAAARLAAKTKGHKAAAVMNPLGVPDYWGTTPNYANSPTTIHKFVDSLPGLGAAGKNDLGQYIPVAVPDTTTFPGSDYYEIALRQYSEKMHTDLPPTTLRGYVQLNNGTDPKTGLNTVAPAPIQYLGPLIVGPEGPAGARQVHQRAADRHRRQPLHPGGHDGHGRRHGPARRDRRYYTQNRAVIHLHGGATPWISDGTPHQWTTPAGEQTSYPKGVSVQNVPDMWFDASGNSCPPARPAPPTTPARARDLLLHQPAERPADVLPRPRLRHHPPERLCRRGRRLPADGPGRAGLVNGDEHAAGSAIPQRQRHDPGHADPADHPGQDLRARRQRKLAAEDPDLGHWPSGAASGNLWFPHVYMPNQNPYDRSGANAMGRWDYGPWFWPPFTRQPAWCTAQSPNPYYDPDNAPWEPPMIPGTPNPSLVPEALHGHAARQRHGLPVRQGGAARPTGSASSTPATTAR